MNAPDDGHSVRSSPGDAPSVNPRLRPGTAEHPSVRDLYTSLRDGDRTALARAITLVESTRPDARDGALELLDLCQDGRRSMAMRIGLSGAPGVGKSTLIDAFGMHLVDRGLRVAVLAIDPSSERSGGSILGDKTRMGRLAANDAAFIRPSPSSGSLGGVARFTRPSITLVETAGYDVVMVETVGVGQSETAVRHMVDTFVLLTVAGTGDELQGIKRGITEAADVVAVTKADGANRDAALAARDTLAGALGLLPADESGWRPQVLAISAFDPDSVADLHAAIERHRTHLRDAGALEARRREQAVRWLRDEITDRLLDGLRAEPAMREALAAIEKAVSRGERHAYRAADELVRRFVRSRPPAGER